jgi:hypothetical protein
MVCFNHPRKFGIFEPHQVTHLKVAAGPVVNRPLA